MRIAITVALWDLMLILVNPTVWRHLRPNKDIIAFVETIRVTVPESSALFSTQSASNTEIITIAYRLNRNILRKPIACGQRGEFFLHSATFADSPPAGVKFDTVSKVGKIALVEVLTSNQPDCAAERPDQTRHDAADNED